MIQPNDPIHPITCENDDRGLTKREHFAALALQGLLNAHGTGLYNECHSFTESCQKRASMAVAYADALINALNAPKESPK